MKKMVSRVGLLDKPNFGKRGFFLYGILLLLVAGLKLHYNRASIENLSWIMAPTAKLVEFASGLDFPKEEYTGYVNIKCRFIISKSCAGINFLILVFLLTVVSRKDKFQTFKQGLINLAGMFAFAYCITLVVNTIRILGAIFLHWNQVSLGWLSPSRIHRLEGTVIYFVSLVMVYGMLKKTKKIKNTPDSSSIKGPVFWYLLITVFFPFFPRLFRKDFSGYIEHCAFVLTTVVLICIILKLFKRKKPPRLSD